MLISYLCVCGPRGRLQIGHRCGSCLNRNLSEIVETTTLVNVRRKRKGRRGRNEGIKERREEKMKAKGNERKEK